MSEFEQGYRTGRGVSGLVTFAGWAVALIGLVVAVLGLLSLLGTDDPLGAMAQIAAIAAGLGVTLGGLVGVAAAQLMRATFDSADMTREMLVLARRRSVPPVPGLAPSRAPVAADRSALPSLTGEPRPKLRAETGPAIPLRPRDGNAKAHPIFSARPPL